MVEVLTPEGINPRHWIGPGMGHSYHPEVIKDVQSQIEAAVAIGRPRMPKKVVLQTRTLAYHRLHWLDIQGLEHEWQDARAEAEWDDIQNVVRLTTQNVTDIALHLPQAPRVYLNGIETRSNQLPVGDETWRWRAGENPKTASLLRKRPGLQGPIDDGFKSRFIVVLPDAEPTESLVDRWVHDESAHFLVRWRSLMRGDAIVRKASDVSKQEMQEAHLVLWGTPRSNSLLAKVVAAPSLKPILRWNAEIVEFGKQSANAATSVPVFCYPNPLHDDRYVIVNSGLTFREAHDRTNSLQNPKLPDWALLDISEPPNAETAGRVIAADFFDNRWQPIDRRLSPTDRSP